MFANKRLKWFLCLLVLLTPIIISAQSDEYDLSAGDGVQQFSGSITDVDLDDVIIYLNDLQAGDTIYAIAKGDGDLDPYLIVTDQDFNDALAEDDDSGGGLNAAISYTVPTAGDYVLGMFSIGGAGEYRIVAGINQPEILSGSSASQPAEPPAPAVDETLITEEMVVSTAGQIFEFNGIFSTSEDEIFVTVPGVSAGDMIYVYASGTGSVDTYIYILDSDDHVLTEDDDSGGGYNSALEYQAETAGNYQIGLITINAAGNYRLLVGINTPDLIETANSSITGMPTDPETFDCSVVTNGERPELSGTMLTLDGATFRIHYTLQGADATTVDYVDDLATALKISLDMQYNMLGWAPPPADCGEGGDNRLDVYVVDMSDDSAIGYASPENIVGDNPNTDAVELYSAYSYLAIENDMEFAARRHGYELMRTTAAHEVHHMIQFGYDVNDRFFGFYEAGASWIETLVYPTQSNAYEYVGDVFSYPDVCIGSTEHADDLRIYGEWLMIDSFTRDLGLSSYQFIWEYMATGEGLRGFYNALDQLGTTPQDIALRSAVRNLLYNYALAKRFTTTVRIEATLDGTGTIAPERDGVQQLGVDYVRIATPGVYTFDLGGEGDLQLYVVGVDSASGSGTLYDLGIRGTVDTTQYDYAYVLILNTLEHTSTESCRYTTWKLAATDGTGDPLTAPTDEVWDATQFIEAR